MRAIMLPRSGVRPRISESYSVFGEPVADVLAYGGFVAGGHESGVDRGDANECLFEGDYLFTLGFNLGE